MGACSVDNADMAAADCSGLSCGVLGPPTPPQEVPTTLSDAPDASAPPPVAPAKDACGIGSCLPDDATQCTDYVPPEPSGGSDAGTGDVDAGTPAPVVDAGVPRDAGTEGPVIDGSFTQPARPAPGPPRFACQLAVSAGKVQRACGVAGSQELEQACTSSIDCAPGLGCVGPAGSGRCLSYCCGVDADSCGPGFYCAERPLRSEAFGTADGPLVPVCDRADNCSLGEEENCTGSRCVCGPDMACQLVGDNRTTACVKLAERPGHAGDKCPCDRGYHCSQGTQTCVKTCALGAEDSDVCGSGVCQVTPVLPEGWGICVGAAPDQMTPAAP